MSIFPPLLLKKYLHFLSLHSIQYHLLILSLLHQNHLHLLLQIKLKFIFYFIFLSILMKLFIALTFHLFFRGKTLLFNLVEICLNLFIPKSGLYSYFLIVTPFYLLLKYLSFPLNCHVISLLNLTGFLLCL
jgi:hypothetical protein